MVVRLDWYGKFDTKPLADVSFCLTIRRQNQPFQREPAPDMYHVVHEENHGVKGYGGIHNGNHIVH